jgi:hypothetical protein
MKLNILILAATFAFAISAFADDSTKPSREQMHQAFEACASQAGLEKPVQGQPPTAPTDEQREKMDACLKAKGIQPPTHFGGPRGGGPGGPPPGSSGDDGGSQ